MEIQYFANITIKSDKHFFPLCKTIEIDSPDIHSIKLPKNAIKIETFYKIFDIVEHNGKIYPTSTEPIDRKVYHIGKLIDASEYQSKGDYIAKLNELGLIKGVIATNFGESIMINNDGLIDPNTINKEGYINKSTKKIKEETKVQAKAEEHVEGKIN